MTETRKPILAIDPGTFESAYVYWDGKKITGHGKCSNDHVLMLCQNAVDTIEVVIEMIASYGMPIGEEVIETCVWIGRFWEAADGRVDRIKRKTICGHLCNDGRAKDANIRQACIDRVGPQWIEHWETPIGKNGQPLKPKKVRVPGPTHGLSKDEWSALAVALTGWDLREATIEQR